MLSVSFFQFVGIVLMAIGTLVELHRSRIEPINNRLAVPTALVIFVGLAIAVNALIGMIGTVMEKPCLLKVVSLLILFWLYKFP